MRLLAGNEAQGDHIAGVVGLPRGFFAQRSKEIEDLRSVLEKIYLE
jgi:hypothetical protein